MLSRLTIKAKLVILGALALAALSCASAVSILSSANINTFNDMARVTQSNKVLATRLIAHRQALLAQYYAAISARADGRIAPDLAEATTETGGKLQDITERLIGRRLAYLDAAEMGKALKLAGEVAAIVTADVPRLIAARASDAEYAALTAAMVAKTAALADIQAGIDGAVADDLATISDRVKAETDNANLYASAVFGVTLVVVSLLLGLIIRSITRPLAAITDTMRALSQGDLDVALPAPRGDEIGTMITAVVVFKDNAVENVRLTEAKRLEQAARDRRQAALDRHTQDFGTSISGVMAGLVDAADEMRRAATAVSEAARETNDGASAAVDGAGNSARDLNTVAVAAEQMAASINEITRQVTFVTEAVQHAVERSNATDAKVASMTEAAARIGDVVRLITDIAGQTNLLALNATIEAARAGEAGKGFAVVAGEVKGLAGQTARATEQIGAQIAAIRDATSEAAASVQDVGTAIGRVAEVASAIAAAVEQQAAATREISGNVQSVTHATTHAAESMSNVVAIAGRTDTISQTVRAAAARVGETAGTLRTEVNDYLAAMTRGDADSRRAYERISGAGAGATLHIPGEADIAGPIRDISLGGIGLGAAARPASGADIRVTLPAAGMVAGRVVRADGTVVGIQFRQDEATLEKVAAALTAISRMAGESRAA